MQNLIEVNAVQGFLQKIFKDLNIRPENYRLILNLPRRVENKCRKSILELVFNTFQVCHHNVYDSYFFNTKKSVG